MHGGCVSPPSSCSLRMRCVSPPWSCFRGMRMRIRGCVSPPRPRALWMRMYGRVSSTSRWWQRWSTRRSGLARFLVAPVVLDHTFRQLFLLPLATALFAKVVIGMCLVPLCGDIFAMRILLRLGFLLALELLGMGSRTNCLCPSPCLADQFRVRITQCQLLYQSAHGH